MKPVDLWRHGARRAGLCALMVPAVLMVSGWWTFAYSGVVGQLVWPAPMVCLAALGFLGSVALRGTAAWWLLGGAE
ncbi:hypothetical protein ACFOY2_16215 [Nonomuraea purpurea]|uniref:Uncharacterized protein n=1 Tax=Nonomuraea purpurea TaxID=1849276 RepID=A0ABV8G448_9ACTN